MHGTIKDTPSGSGAPARTHGRPDCFLSSATTLLATVLVSAAVGCGGSAERGTETVPVSFEENVLYGGASCGGDDSCLAGLCVGGACVGFLVIPSDMARDQAGLHLKSVIEGNPGLAGRLSEAAARVLMDETAETFGRARAADLFRFLPCGVEHGSLVRALESTSEAVRFYSARVLALCGDRDGIGALEGFLGHRSEPVRTMARNALDSQPAR